MPIWDKALWILEVCIKVGHVNAHRNNSLVGLEGNWNQQEDISPTCHLEVATWVHTISGAAAAMWRWAESRHIPHAPPEAPNTSENCPVC